MIYVAVELPVHLMVSNRTMNIRITRPIPIRFRPLLDDLGGFGLGVDWGWGWSSCLLTHHRNAAIIILLYGSILWESGTSPVTPAHFRAVINWIQLLTKQNQPNKAFLVVFLWFRVVSFVGLSQLHTKTELTSGQHKDKRTTICLQNAWWIYRPTSFA